MKFTLVAAALAATTAADFVVVTDFPKPTDLSQLLNVESYVSSLANYVTEELASFTASANPSLISEKAKVQKELESFVATASYSIPSDVTALGAYETYTEVPDWYSALPSAVKSYYDKSNKVVESIMFQAAGVNQTGTASGSTGATAATATGSGTSASQTGAANKVAVMGAGMVAAFLGVVAL